jgi:hypothetical protein
MGADAGHAVNVELLELPAVESVDDEDVPEGSGALGPASESLATLPPHAARRRTRPTAIGAATTLNPRFTLPI